VRKSLIPAEDESGLLRALDAEVQACLALSRATLRALAALSPTLSSATEAALEEEAERVAERAAPQRTLEIVEETRQRLQRAPDEARIARALEQALVDAAEALPPRVA